MNNTIQTGITKYKRPHIPSAVDPDTLFTFTTDLKWLVESLENKMLSPRYNEEDIRFLGISNLKKLIVPMKCFCDINLQKLNIHMDWYGDYGIAFGKKWGINQGLQPIQYVNPNSILCKDLSTAFKEAIRVTNGNNSDSENKVFLDLKSELLLDLLFKKPYTGRMVKRKTSKKSNKCLADEHEWRFIPNSSLLGLPPVILDQDFNKEAIASFSNAMKGKAEVSLQFDYSDIKHIIIKNLEDYRQLVMTIKKWDIDEMTQYAILSHVIVWDELKGDF